MQVQYGKKTYLQIGKLLVSKHKNLADSIIQNYLQPHSVDTDLSNVVEYWKAFDLYDSFFKRQDYYCKRLFISLILRIYTPGIYDQPHHDLVIKHGLVRAMSRVSGISEGYVSKMIRQATALEKISKEYCKEVDHLLDTVLTEKSKKAC